MTKRVCVIGGGISGLCVAYRLKQAGVAVTLFEKSSSVGGNIKTEIVDGFLIEHGPNSTLLNRELLDLINDLRIPDQIQAPNARAKKRYILLNGNLVQLPARVVELFFNRALSFRAKLRLLREPLIRSKAPPDESVAGFFERRFGREIVERIVDPFVSGIYAGNPNRLSVRCAFPRLVELERRFGSVIMGSIFARPRKGSELPKGSPRSVTFKNGMQTLTDELYSSLQGIIRLGVSVEKVSRSAGCIKVQTTNSLEEFDAVVVSTPSNAAEDMIRGLDPSLARRLGDVYYSPVAVVFTAFRSDQVEGDPQGFGFLVPSGERRDILGSLWTSSAFEGRTPKDGDWHLFTTFVGGSRNAQLALVENDELIGAVLKDLRDVLGINGDPRFSIVRKWEAAIPQYDLGYEKLYDAISTFRKSYPEVFFCSNFYRGISVSDCVKNAAATADEILDLLNS